MGFAGRLAALFVHRDRLEKVTAEDVKRRRDLKADNRTIGQFLPTKSPDRSPFHNSDWRPQSATTRAFATATGEAFDVAGEHDKRTRRVTLPTGIQSRLLENCGQSVNIRIRLKYGDEKNLQGMAKAAELLPDLMTRGRKARYQELLDSLDKHRVRLTATEALTS
jgi:hypothetical protein